MELTYETEIGEAFLKIKLKKLITSFKIEDYTREQKILNDFSGSYYWKENY